MTRRGALTLLPAAAASVAAPAAVYADPFEHPCTKTWRLFRELKEALAEADGFHGQFAAIVYPGPYERGGLFSAKRAEEIWNGGIRASREVEQLAAMSAVERSSHYSRLLCDTLNERKPGNWRANAICNDDDELCAYLFARYRDGAL